MCHSQFSLSPFAITTMSDDVAVPSISIAPNIAVASDDALPAEPPRPTWTISGGSNDQYYVWPDRFLYKPVRPEQSSSLHYSGGEPCDIPLTPAQFAEIDQTLAAFLDPHHPHISPERNMGVSILQHRAQEGQRQQQLLNSAAQVTAVLDRLRTTTAATGVPEPEKKKGFFQNLFGSK
jgi:hypothetical protein